MSQPIFDKRIASNGEAFFESQELRQHLTSAGHNQLQWEDVRMKSLVKLFIIIVMFLSSSAGNSVSSREYTGGMKVKQNHVRDTVNSSGLLTRAQNH